jgi:hypothetical protein
MMVVVMVDGLQEHINIFNQPVVYVMNRNIHIKHVMVNVKHPHAVRNMIQSQDIHQFTQTVPLQWKQLLLKDQYQYVLMPVVHSHHIMVV